MAPIKRAAKKPKPKVKSTRNCCDTSSDSDSSSCDCSNCCSFSSSSDSSCCSDSDCSCCSDYSRSFSDCWSSDDKPKRKKAGKKKATTKTKMTKKPKKKKKSVQRKDSFSSDTSGCYGGACSWKPTKKNSNRRRRGTKA